VTRPLCEVRVFSRRYRYAGTLDVLGIWNRAGALIDYKTGAARDVGAWWQTGAYLGALHEMIANGDTSEMVAFDKESHTYSLDGERLPSVTQVLGASVIDFSRIPPSILNAAMARGTAVHAAAHYFNESDLDVAAFERDYPTYWPYLSAWIDFRRDSGFQLATSLEQIGSLSHVKRYAVQLRKDGTYKVETYQAPSDFREFITLLQAQQIAARHKGSWIEVAA
jgi:hypothetical protein